MNLHKWFHENYMVLNSDKCHYVVIGDNEPSIKITLNNNEIASSNKENPSGILLDSKLNFDSHITSICKKAGQKLSALTNNKSLPHLRSENLAVKLSSKTPVQLLPTVLNVYCSLFKYCIKQHLRTGFAFDLQ